MILCLCGPDTPSSQSLAPEVSSGPLGVWRSPRGRVLLLKVYSNPLVGARLRFGKRVSKQGDLGKSLALTYLHFFTAKGAETWGEGFTRLVGS